MEDVNGLWLFVFEFSLFSLWNDNAELGLELIQNYTLYKKTNMINGYQ